MIDNVRLALYCFLHEMGACREAKRVFDEHPEPTRAEFEWIMEVHMSRGMVSLLSGVMFNLEPLMRAYYYEAFLLRAADDYHTLEMCTDNTYQARFEALLYGPPQDDLHEFGDLPFGNSEGRKPLLTIIEQVVKKE